MKSFLDGKKSLTASPLVAPAGPAARQVPGAKNAHAHSMAQGAKAHVEIVKEGDKVVRIFVTCQCGERTEIECLYPVGS